MSYAVFAVVLVSAIVLGWIGFLIIAVALVRDSVDAYRHRGSRPAAETTAEEEST